MRPLSTANVADQTFTVKETFNNKKCKKKYNIQITRDEAVKSYKRKRAAKH